MKMLMTMPVRMMLVMMMNDGDNADAGGGGDVGEATVGFMRGTAKFNAVGAVS